MKAFDEYEIKARYVPTFICMVPLSNFLVVFLGRMFFENLVNNIAWMLIANLSVSLIIMLAVMQVQCTIAKYVFEEHIFGKGGLGFHTTNMLLYTKGLLSKDRKNQIREKLLVKTGIRLSTEDEEKADIAEAQLQAREAVNAIRNIVGKGSFTITYNIRYGFLRNLIGGSFFVLLGSVFCMGYYFYFHEFKSLIFFTVYFVVFAILIIFAKNILEKPAHSYADRHFSEFLSISEKEN
jgi:hypothetical protein